MRTDFRASEFHVSDAVRAAKRRRSRQRVQQTVGVLMLLAGYLSLAVAPDSEQSWVLIRVVVGFVLLFGGFAVAIGPTVSAIMGDHE